MDTLEIIFYCWKNKKQFEPRVYEKIQKLNFICLLSSSKNIVL
jgi:hypothetical protein